MRHTEDRRRPPGPAPRCALMPEHAVASETPLDAFARVTRWRSRAMGARAILAALLAGVVYLATRDPLTAAYFAVAVAVRFVEEAAALGLPPRLGWRAAAPWVAAGQAASTLSFVSIIGLLLRQSDPVRVAEAGVVLCAVAVANAMQAAGSRLASLSLLGPATLALVAAPLWAGFAARLISPVDAGLLAFGGLVFTVFIARLANMLHAEGEASRSAGRAAAQAARRWGMAFHTNPVARVCFDATALHDRLHSRAGPDTGLGTALRAELAADPRLTGLVSLIEMNAAAQALVGADAAGPFPESLADGLCRALDEMGPDGALPPFEAELRHADGRVTVVQAHFRLTAGFGAPWSLCFATYVDMTASRELVRVQQVAREAAEAATQAQNDFLGVMSHEIRTPLNGVLGMAQAMDRDPLPPAQRERLKVIRESGQSLLLLLDDLLDLSRIEAGRLKLELADFDLKALLEGVYADFSARARAQGLDFDLHMDPGLAGQWRGDAARVRQVVVNLVSNALKFTPAGRIEIRATGRATGVKLEVADTGIGIPPELSARLFEKFVLLDASATRAYPGAGLGLAISRELCRAMGGEIGMRSRPGHGSVFTIDLPLRQMSRDEAPAGSAVLIASQPGALRVLAAEDNAVNRTVLRTLLAQFEIEPTIVENGAEAVRAWEAAHWDLILMDVQMPVMDGPTATMTIRAREGLQGRARTPILAVTANVQAHQVASYRAAGMDDVVAKPINVHELLGAIAAAVAAAEDPAEDARAAG